MFGMDIFFQIFPFSISKDVGHMDVGGQGLSCKWPWTPDLPHVVFWREMQRGIELALQFSEISTPST